MTLRVGLMKEQQQQQQQHGPLPEAYRKDLGLVDARINELVTLINDFLEIARSEGVGLTLVPESIDLVVLVRANLSDFQEIAEVRQVKLRFDEPPGPVHTLADPARLKQVITNLVSNAVKFGAKGGQVLVEVKLSELFKRYSRPASAVTDTALPGTGLGLMIVREIVAAHCGTCGVESTLGKGSRFWFRLPRPA